MTKRDKLISRFLCDYQPNLTWDDAVKVLGTFGYEVWGKENGTSHKTFVKRPKDGMGRSSKFKICRPHPDPTLKRYQFDELKELIKAELEMIDQGRSHG